MSSQKQQAKEFQMLNGEVLSHAIAKVSLNKQDGEIFYTTLNPYSIPTLNIYNGESLQTNDADLDNGKLFKIDGKYYGVGVNYSDYNHMKVMVRDSNREPLQELSGKVVQDMYQNHILYLEPSAFNGFKLHEDGQYIAEVNSNAIYDERGAIYYFKQEGLNRVLYKNKEKIVSFEGYYSKPVEVSGDTIYFIASTPLGGGLFAYKESKIYRVTNGDNIEDFRQINGNYGLFSVLKSDGYEVLKAKLDFHEETPYFKKLLSFELPQLTSNLPQESKEYNSWAEIRPTAFNLFTLGFENLAMLELADPMLNHTITLMDMLFIFPKKDANGVEAMNVLSGSYLNTEHRFQYGVGVSASNATTSLSLVGAYLLNIDDGKSSKIGVTYYHENVSDNYSELYYNYTSTRTYGISPTVNKEAKFTLYGGNYNNEKFALGVNTKYANTLGDGWYYGAALDMGVATQSYFDVSNNLVDGKLSHINTNVGAGASYSGDKLLNLNLQLTKNIELPFYFTNPYVSAIRRELLTLYAQPIYIGDARVFEYGLKTQTEFALIYRFPLTLELTFYKNSTQSDMGVAFGLNSTF